MWKSSWYGKAGGGHLLITFSVRLIITRLTKALDRVRLSIVLDKMVTKIRGFPESFSEARCLRSASGNNNNYIIVLINLSYVYRNCAK